jgi:transposase
MAAHVETLPEDPATLQAMLRKQQAEITRLQDQLHSLLESLRLEKHRLYGARSEKAPGQAELFDEPEATADTPEASPGPVPETPSPAPRKPAVRKPLPRDLPRIRRVYELPAAARQCPCGCELSEIGEEISEQIDIIPARVQVIEHVRKKYACKTCEDTIQSAPRPPQLLPKSLATGNTMAYIITSKYADGLPLYRLSGILARYGIELPRQTLSESVLKVAEKLSPIIAHMKAQLLAGDVLHMDETRVQVLNEPDKPAQSQSYMWVQRGGPPGQPIVQFTYDPSRAATVADRLLEGYRGALMTDGYTAYRVVAQRHSLNHLCCWSHARRKFIEAQKAQPKGKTGKADMAVNFIAKLYAIEKQSLNSDAAARHRARQERSGVILAQFHAWLLKTRDQVPPKNALGKAVHYTLEYWPQLTRYIENGNWPIDNNVAENAIRPFVIGRKNWLFSNSQRGATASANLYSLIETAKANSREPYQYLSWLFERLPAADLANCESLMPWHSPRIVQEVV